jgi:hypothetical protein
MKLQDAVDYIEDQFTCEQGAPWRWADLLMTKPYQTVTFDNDVPSLSTVDDLEHRLVARLINEIRKLKQSAGFRADTKPKLFWRWANKIRIEDGVITTRIYIDGNPGLSLGNPSNPRGRPTVGQIKLAA